MTKNIRVDDSQKEMMLDFMSANSEFAAGRLLGPLGKQKESEMWGRLTSMLNSAGVGATKTVDKWMKTWSDWKLNVKGRASEIRIYEGGTGGGRKCPKKLSDLELRLLEFIGWSAVCGLNNVQEAGLGEVAAAGPATVSQAMGSQQSSTNINTSTHNHNNPTSIGLTEVIFDLQGEYGLGLVEMDSVGLGLHAEDGDGDDTAITHIEMSETPVQSSSGKRKRTNRSEAKKPILKDPFSQAAKSFESIEEKRTKLYEEIRDSLKTIAESSKSIATAEGRKATALERIAAAKEKKYGIVSGE